jgi:hypothetical protein
MRHLASRGNLYNTCLILLRKKGYALRYNKDNEDWFASSGEVSLQADNPIELLGMVSIHEAVPSEAKGDYWWRMNSPDIWGELDPTLND